MNDANFNNQYKIIGEFHRYAAVENMRAQLYDVSHPVYATIFIGCRS